MKDQQICIMGMGYVGLTLSVVLAEVGYNVHGIEIDDNVVAILNDGVPHFHEENLAVRLRQQLMRKKLKISNKLPDSKFDIYIISVGTPLVKENKTPNLLHIDKVVSDVGSHLTKGSLVCLRSTIPVGLTRNRIVPFLEKTSKLKAGVDFGVAFTPERTIEGKALSELRENPQIIGGLTQDCTDRAEAFFHKLTPTIITVSSVETAEAVKLVDNSYRDVRFAFANELALISEKLGLDAVEIVRSANIHYPRNNIPVPSPGVGGACLSKDPHILIDFSKKAGYEPELIIASRKINEGMPCHIVRRIAETLKTFNKDIKTANILLTGFAFKGDPETTDTRDSTTLWLLDELKKYTDNIVCHDAIIKKEEIEKYGFKFVEAPRQGVDDLDVLIIANNHLSYRNWDVFELAKRMGRPAVIYDSWGMLNKQIAKDIDNIIYMGTGI